MIKKTNNGGFLLTGNPGKWLPPADGTAKCTVQQLPLCPVWFFWSNKTIVRAPPGFGHHLAAVMDGWQARHTL